MKILLVSDYGVPQGGVEVLLPRLKRLLLQKGHDARIFTSSAGMDQDHRFSDYTCFGTTSRFRTLLQTVNLSAYLKLRKVLSRFKPDVVHVRMFLTQLSPLILPLLKNIPAMYQVEWCRPICPIGSKRLPDGRLCQVSPGIACLSNHCLPLRDWGPLMLQMKGWRNWRYVFDVIVASSEAIKSYLIQEGISPVEVVKNGIEELPFRSPLSPPPTVVFAGRLVREKGAAILLRAFAKVLQEMPESRLLIAGRGEEEDTLRSMMGELKIAHAVTMLGYLPREEMGTIFSKAWVQAVPSLCEEAFPLVTMEAMARGICVVASDRGGVREVVHQGKTGFLVPGGDVQTWSETLIHLLKRPDLCDSLGKAGRALALGSFSEEKFLERILNLYEVIRQPYLCH